MSKFTNFDPDLSVEVNPWATHQLGKTHWVVKKSFDYYVGKKNDGVYIRIPFCYLTDGASIPIKLQRFIPAWGKYGAAAIVHDYLCEHLTVIDNGEIKPISRKEADRIFYEAMRVLKVPLWQRLSFWIAVRLYVRYYKMEKPMFQTKKHYLEILLEEHYSKTGNFNIGESND